MGSVLKEKELSLEAKGTVEYDDMILFVMDIFLLDGGFFIVAKGYGPSNEYKGPANVYGRDGVLLVYGGDISVPAAGKNQPLTLEMRISLSEPVAD